MGGVNGVLGYPTSEPQGTGVSGGLQVRYDRGTIYRATSSATPVAVTGAVDTEYRRRGGPSGSLGYPTSRTARSDGSQLVRFTGGALVQIGSGSVVAVTLAFLDAGLRFPTTDPDHVGWPVANLTTIGGQQVQRFEGGVVTRTAGGTAFAIGSDLADPYLADGGAAGPGGAPLQRAASVAGGRARALWLERGVLVAGPAGTHLIVGAVHDAYVAEGGPDGRLGLPTSSSATVRGGQQRASFERGTIILGTDGGAQVLTTRSGSRPDSLASTSPSGGAPRRGRTPGDLSR